MKMFPVIILFIILMSNITNRLLAQDNVISNVVFSVVSQKVSVFYDLSGISNQKYKVTAKFRSKVDTLNEYNVNSYEGMLGNDISSGFNNSFNWNYKDDISFIPNTTDYEFLFKTEPVTTSNQPFGKTQKKDESKSSGSSTWFYYVGGALIVVVALALTVFRPEDKQPEEDAIPNPPKRPY